MNSDVGNRGIFLKQEEFFFDQLVQIFNQYRMDVLDSLIRGNFLLSEPKSIKKEEDVQKDIQKVKFLDVVLKFIGEDLNIYGPYEMEQEVDLPIKMVDLLVKIGKVKKI